MATNHRMFVPTHPGLVGVKRLTDFHVPSDDQVCAYMAANPLAALFNKSQIGPIVGGGRPYTSGQWNATTTGTGAAVAEATTPGGGILLTCGSTSTFNTDLNSKIVWTPATSLWISGSWRVQVSHATQVGFDVGLGTNTADPQTSFFTDAIVFEKAVGGATVVGKVRGDSGTAASTGTLLTMVAATEYYVGYYVKLNATAGSVQGYWVTGALGGPYTVTPFTANQRTQAAAILTTPPSVGHNLSAKGTTGQNPTLTVTAGSLQVDN